MRARTHAMDIEQCIETYGARVDALLRKILPRDGADFLSDPIWHHLSAGGKRVRPALCLVTCEALGGDPEAALPFAAAVELLHNMLLVHDDLEDGDTMRRDEPTVWVKYGMANAVNAGDYLLGKAYAAVLRSPVEPAVKLRLLETFTLTYTRTVEGQALDLNLRADPAVTIEKYLNLAELKTGHCLACGMVGGAIVAAAHDAVIELLWRVGRKMGAAFQIRDDVIDLTAGKGRGGALGSDIKEGKASVLYAHALGASGPADRGRLLAIMARSREATSDPEVQWVADLYRRVGSINLAERTADGLTAEAQQMIKRLPAAAREPVNRLAAFMVERAK